MNASQLPMPSNVVVEDSERSPRCGVSQLAPPDVSDPVIEIYKRHVDRTLLLSNLSLTPAQRAEKLVDFVAFLDGLRQAGKQVSS